MKRVKVQPPNGNARAIWPGSAVVASLFTLAILPPQAAVSAREVHAVVSPLGEETTVMIEMAPRLDSLENKTLCMLGNDAFKVNVTMPVIATALRERFNGLRVVPYTELPEIVPGAQPVLPESIQDEFHSKGCDAVISGNGG